MGSSTGKEIIFEKMQALGNDFVVIDGVFGQVRLPFSSAPIPASFSAGIRHIAHRRFGVGCDQVLWLVPSTQKADVWMRVFNADGTEAETCGNGLRAVALWLSRLHPNKEQTYTIETGGERVQARVTQGAGSEQAQVQIAFPSPKFGAGFGPSEPPLDLQVVSHEGARRQLPVHTLSVGNPHAVVFVESPAFSAPLPAWQSGLREQWGPGLERHASFSQGTNVEFIWTQSPVLLKVEVWERGAGPTWACGTGGMAAALAAMATGRVAVGKAIEVLQPGGSLWVEWSGEKDSRVYMTGPAQWVFRGVLSDLGLTR